jgi:HEAT repeat protein/GTPase SAR1 family protein
MDPTSALLLFVLFRATEKVISYAGGKIADALSKPIWEALEDKARWWAGDSETARRWRAFSQAFEQAKAGFIAQSPDPALARRIAAIFETDQVRPADRYLLEKLAAELETVNSLVEQPNIEAMTDLCRAIFQRQQPDAVPAAADISEALSRFIRQFDDHLFAWPEYRQTKLQQRQWQQLRQQPADTRARYLDQLMKYHRHLDFVGIPELKDRQGLQLEDIFINLQAEVELEVPRRRPKGVEGAVIEVPDYPRETLKRRVSLNEALAEHRWLVILGDPGAGKTTLLKYITVAFAQDCGDWLGLAGESRLPIFIRLADYMTQKRKRNEDYSPVRYLYTQARENLALLNLPERFFEEALERGECCLCLDGLDELGQAGLRREVSQAVTALAHRYPRNRFLITSRQVGYQEAPLSDREFIHHTILPFSDEDIERFVRRWYEAREVDPAAAESRAKHLVGTIMAEPKIKELATNPLLLTIIALVHRIEAELPHERVKLYEKCVTALIQTWEQAKQIERELSDRPGYERYRSLLRQVAYWLHTQPLEADPAGPGRAQQVEEGDLKAQIVFFLLEDPELTLGRQAAWAEAEAFVERVKARTGLLVERGEGRYAFAHLTFQEYLAAEYLKFEYGHSIDELWDIIQPHLHTPRWREVILLLLGSLNEFRKHNTELMKRILAGRDEYEALLHRHLFLSSRALADRIRVEAGLQQVIIEQLLQIARTETLACDDALNALGGLKGNSQAAEGLLALAQNPAVDAGVRGAAAQALGQLGQPEPAAAILLALAQDPAVEAGVRRDAAQALGQLGQPEPVILAGLLALAQDPAVEAGVRSDAAETLGQLGQPEPAAAILLALAQDLAVEAGVRRAAAETLGRLGQPEPAILAGLLTLAQDPAVDDRVRHDAAQALGQLGQPEPAAAILLALAQDPAVGRWVRGDAAQTLGQLGQPEPAILSGLLALAQDPEVDDWVRHDAALALGQLGQPEPAAAILLALAQDPAVDIWVRGDAALVLGQLGRPEPAILSGLLALAQDPAVDDWVRCLAAQALGRLGQPEPAAAILLALAQDPAVDDWVRHDAAQTLGQLGQPEPAILAGLLALAQEPAVDAGVRRAAAQALGQLGQPEPATAILLALAQDPEVDAGARSDAYGSLKSLLGEGQPS